MSNNLNKPDLEANQNQPEVPINDFKGRLDAAITEDFSFVVDDSNAYILAAEDFRAAVLFDASDDSTPPDAAVTITIPAVARGLFYFTNDMSQDATVTISGQSETAPVIEAGESALLRCDGVNVLNAASAGGASTFLELTDTPSSLSGQALKAVRVNSGETALEFTDEIGGSVTGSIQLTAGFKGALATLDGTQTIADSTNVALAWDTVEYDTGYDGSDFFDLGTDDTIITIPAGVSKVRFTAGARVDAGTMQIYLERDSGGGFAAENFFPITGQSTGSELQQSFASGVIEVSDGDEFRIIARLTGGGAPSTFTSLHSYFSVEVVETSDNVAFQAVAVATKPRFKGAMAILTADNTGLDLSSFTKLEWDDTQYDTGVDGTAFFDNVSDRLVVPAGVSRVRITANVVGTNLAAGSDDRFGVFVYKNGSILPTGGAQFFLAGATGYVSCDTGVISVVPGDYFEIFADSGDDTSVDILAAGTSFCIEVEEEIGATDVPSAYIAVQPKHIGCFLRHSTTQGSLAASTQNPLNFDTELYDTGYLGVPFHDTVTNNSRITIPAGVTKVRLAGGGSVNDTTDGSDRSLEFLLNGSSMTPRVISRDASPGGTSLIHALASEVIEVSEGDYFEIAEFHGNGTGTTVNGVNWFAMTVVETDEALSFPGVTVERPHIGCNLLLSTSLTSQNFTGGFTALGFDDENYDTGHLGVAFHDTVTNNERITIPAGVTKVELTASVRFSNFTAGASDVGLQIRKNGTADESMVSTTVSTRQDGSTPMLSVTTGVLEVSEADYFEALVFNTDDTSVDVEQTGTSFTMTVIETADAAFPPHQIEVYLDTWMGALPTSDTCYKMVASRRFSLFDDLAGSVGHANAGPNGAAVDIDVQVNGSSIGTISFADSSGAAQTATFVTAGGSQEDLEVGDRLELVGPANWQSMDEIAISLLGFRT